MCFFVFFGVWHSFVIRCRRYTTFLDNSLDMTSWVSFLFSSSSLLFLTHVRPSPSRVKWLPPGVQTIHWALYFLSSRCFRSVFKTFLPRFLLSFVHSFFFMSVCDVQCYVYSCVQPSTHIADTTRAFAQVFI